MADDRRKAGRGRPPARTGSGSSRREPGKPSGSARGAGGRGRPEQRTGKPTGKTGGKPTGKTAGKPAGGFGPYHKGDGDEPPRRRRPDEPRRRPDADARRSALRVVGKRQKAAEPKSTRKTAARAPAKPRRRRRKGPADVEQEIARLADRNAGRFFKRLMDAADAYAHDREREALRILRPLRDQIPDSPSVRELVGLCQYRIGNYNAAVKELEAYAELADSVEQNPVLMDCYRAQRRWRKVETAWEELAAVSPSGEVVTEGRIVYAGALADQGRMDDALALLRKRAESVRSPLDHHLRLWYALADLEERAGNVARARDLFDQVRRADPQYVDVAERRAALG